MNRVLALIAATAVAGLFAVLLSGDAVRSEDRDRPTVTTALLLRQRGELDAARSRCVDNWAPLQGAVRNAPLSERTAATAALRWLHKELSDARVHHWELPGEGELWNSLSTLRQAEDVCRGIAPVIRRLLREAERHAPPPGVAWANEWRAELAAMADLADAAEELIRSCEARSQAPRQVPSGS